MSFISYSINPFQEYNAFKKKIKYKININVERSLMRYYNEIIDISNDKINIF